MQKVITALKINNGNNAVGEVKLHQTNSDYNRNKNLLEDQAIIQKDLDDTTHNFDSAEKLLENNKIKLAAAKSKIPDLKSVIKKWRAFESKN